MKATETLSRHPLPAPFLHQTSPELLTVQSTPTVTLPPLAWVRCVGDGCTELPTICISGCDALISGIPFEVLLWTLQQGR